MQDQKPDQTSTGTQAHAQEDDPWTEWEGDGGAGAQLSHAAPTPPQPDKATAPAEQSKDAGTPPAKQATADPGQPAAIHKGIYLSALIYVEADFPPAVDFIGPATAAVKKAFSTSLSGGLSGITMTLKSVDVQNNLEDADTKPKARIKGESKFQF